MSSIIVQFAIPRDTSFISKVSSKRRCFTAATSATSRDGQHARCSLQVGNEIETERRTGGYQPTLWDYDSIQSFEFEYKEEKQLEKAATLIEKVKRLLLQGQRLELIDDLRRLGISCHFRNEIDQILNTKYLEKNELDERDLYSTSLRFRLLRQYGFTISQDVFDCFKNDKATDFDTKGLLQLYEASFLATHGEETLEIAREFAAKSLHQRVVDHEIDDIHLLSSVEAAFEFPSHWRVQMPYAKGFIDAYKKRQDMNPVVLELAKLDINIVQAQFLEELKETSRWWERTGLAQELPFIRDRIVECYYWANGMVERREHGFERIMLAKINALITAIDDIYDVYGTLEELQLFTDAIRRWDIESIDKLPPYMKVCYLTLIKSVYLQSQLVKGKQLQQCFPDNMISAFKPDTFQYEKVSSASHNFQSLTNQLCPPTCSVDDRRSTSGFVFNLGSGAVTWSSKKQGVTALSTAEAEYVAATSSACQGLWLRRVLADFEQEQKQATGIFCDNRSTVAIAKNQVMHGRTKHIDIKFHFIRDLINEGVISLKFCSSLENLADIFTKSLSSEKHVKFRNMLGVCNYESRGSVE
ncbi:cineole synthase 1, chloroplastic-like [Salvia hispanica]|uniref:cineole synthase 1, chloroplastic-like n=1 Tax=Salvia hispanica TaxID=49212 RepID=UPI0020090472|nr:cineole synthase 1, chloroplastic-like [Salvia hispanica]